MCKNYDRCAGGAASEVGLHPLELVGSQGTETARLELQDIDQRDEVNAGMVKTVVALVVGGLDEAVEIVGNRRIGGVVFARSGVELCRAQSREQLLRQIEFGRPRQMGDIPRVEDECRLL